MQVFREKSQLGSAQAGGRTGEPWHEITQRREKTVKLLDKYY